MVGIRGVGSWAAEALARSGVGTPCFWSISTWWRNQTPNRQIRPRFQFGQAKGSAPWPANCRESIRIVRCARRKKFATPGILQTCSRPSLDAVIDATDQVRAKWRSRLHCRNNGIRLVTVGAAGSQIDPTRVRVDDRPHGARPPVGARCDRICAAIVDFPGKRESALEFRQFFRRTCTPTSS